MISPANVSICSKRCSDKRRGAIWSSVKEDKSTQDKIIYDFLALSFVRRSPGDVAAVTVEQKPETVTVSWTKNTVETGDEIHIERIADCLQTHYQK
jgi:hypothetical protein